LTAFDERPYAAASPAADRPSRAINEEYVQVAITVPGVTVELDQPVPMRDGTILRADVYRPVEPGTYPVLLIRIPYDKTQSENVIYAHPSWYARHGYIVVCQDTRGRYKSDGVFYPFRHEAEDGFDTIEWCGRLAGSTGTVGTFGASYGGATQLLAATQCPPSLGTMIPTVTPSQYYEGWTYNQGAFALGFALSWALSLGVNAAQKRGDDAAASSFAVGFASSLDLDRSLPLDSIPTLDNQDTPYFKDWIAHPTYDEYWKQWSIDEDYSRIEVPVLHVAGWYDIFLSGSVKNFVGMRSSAGNEHARANQRLVIGPWYHIPWRVLGGVEVDVASPHAFDEWQIDWFDRQLKSEPVVDADAPVRLYILREGRWRDFDAWPPSGTKPINVYLHSGGRANSAFGDGSLSCTKPASELPDVYAYDPVGPLPGPGGHSCCFPNVAPMGPLDQEPREVNNGVLIYTSEPLAEPMWLIGDMTATIYAATTAVDTDYAVRLCVVDNAGISTNIQEGIVRARYRDSLSKPTLLEPGKIYRYEIPLGPVGVKLESGERLRVQVTSNDFPQWDRNMNTGNSPSSEGLSSAIVATQAVYHDADHPSWVSLPVWMPVS
jgi:putative CocE/NonD family hydrolase